VVLRYFVSLFVRPGSSVARTFAPAPSSWIEYRWEYCNVSDNGAVIGALVALGGVQAGS
jgi:hypothetical protein